ncbi:MAG: exosortase E/protease, VPEID-CTERM system [Terracidiphilus sp.]
MQAIRGSTGNNRSQSVAALILPRHLLGRLYLFAAIVALDDVMLGRLINRGFVLPLQPFPFAIISFAVFLGLGHSWLKGQREILPFGFVSFGLHLTCLAAAMSFFSFALPAIHQTGSSFSFAADSLPKALIGLSFLPLALACIPFRTWIRTFRLTSPLWLYATLAGAFAAVLGPLSWKFWSDPVNSSGKFLQVATFNSVQWVLRFFLPGAVADPATFTISAPRFSADIYGPCSGIQGLGLVLGFTAVWLWYRRRQARFPQAFLLVPVALGCIWLLNIVRISTLFVIGDKVSPDIAMGGFHSEAGWIAFTAVALGFSLATQKLSWVRKMPVSVPHPAGFPRDGGSQAGRGVQEELHEESGESAATGAYLVPFLAILAASFVSKLATANFEWLYPLRFVAAAVALWHFRPELKKLNWRVGWAAPLAGVGVFLVWIAPSWWAQGLAPSPLGPALAALSPSARFTWIAFRVVAAVITVPIAEELAFRGYLARRLVNREFDQVSFSSLTIIPIVLSSVAFGLMHGEQWMAGIFAGLVFALALRRRGRMGDAVVAHAISNLLLAVWVLSRGDWAQW